MSKNKSERNGLGDAVPNADGPRSTAISSAEDSGRMPPSIAIARTRSAIEEDIQTCKDTIEGLKTEILELRKEGLLLCDEQQRFEEKIETITEKDGRKRFKREALIGRVFWKETFVDEDTGNHITVERNQVIRKDGEWE